jgi:hypothetical protein
MRTSPTFRPVVDGLESRNLLSTVYLAGTLRGTWTLPSTLNTRVSQTQTLNSGDTAHFRGDDASGHEIVAFGFTAKLNQSSLTMPPLSQGGVVSGALKLTLSPDLLSRFEVHDNVTLSVGGTVEKTPFYSVNVIKAKLTFPTTKLNGIDNLGQEIILLREQVNRYGTEGEYAMTFVRS